MIIHTKLREVEIHMDGKPIHFDGSVQNNDLSNLDSMLNEPFTLTDEMRSNISGNPFGIENTK